VDSNECRFSAVGLYEPGLRLAITDPVVAGSRRGPPEATSHGMDLYLRVLGARGDARATTALNVG
jgi:hypothetical protein